MPQEWRHADITMIPKPGKPPSLNQLRPISLTSCVGKLLEPIVLARLQPYIDEHAPLPLTMFGFDQGCPHRMY